MLEMSTKPGYRTRKQRHKDDMKQEIVAQVHATIKKDVRLDSDNVNKIENSESSSETNKTYTVEDKNDNYSIHTPSRDVSVDGEAQINSKITSLIEEEMKRDVNKHSHFTDSRPQSLSFYEDEKIPEELSGNLELLSPEERKHYKKRKEHGQMDTEERNAYNVIQDLYNQEDDVISTSTKKSKSRKKRHADPEAGMGDSREMMIPKEKRKSKKKKRENSPIANGKRKHRKRDDEQELKTEITIALEELQDDVFDNSHEEINKPEKMKKSPRKSDSKVYVQKKNKFEATNRPILRNNDNISQCSIEVPRTPLDFKPIELAATIQKYCNLFSIICQGLLAGMGLGHLIFLHASKKSLPDFVVSYAYISDLYMCTFYLLCVICLVGVLDRYDVAHLDGSHLAELIRFRQSAIVVLIYAVCLVLHLSVASVDDKIALIAHKSSNITIASFTRGELEHWHDMSLWRSVLAVIPWLISGMVPATDLLYVHLKNMEKYIMYESNMDLCCK